MTSPKARVALRELSFQRAESIMAKAADVMITRTPVAEAPLCASTLALKITVMANAMAVWINTSGLTALPRSGAMP